MAWDIEDIRDETVVLRVTDLGASVGLVTEFNDPLWVMQAFVEGATAVTVTDQYGVDVLNGVATGLTPPALLAPADLENGILSRGPLTIATVTGGTANPLTLYCIRWR